MKIKNVINGLFPAVVMTLLTLVSFSKMELDTVAGLDFKGLFLISILIIFPLLFLMQGSLCARNKSNIVDIVLSFGLSILNYMILMKTYLNDSAYIYILVYSILWIIGYIIMFMLKKIK